MDVFETLAGRVEAELVARGSRFLALVTSVRSREEAEGFHAAQTRAFRDATHVVPAFALRDGTAWSSDAGEPSGSAGPPILRALHGAGVMDVAAVVVRWYGGTNLGIGGLVRAYSGVVTRALDGAERHVVVRSTRLLARFPHERTSSVLHAVASHGGSQVVHGFDGEQATCSFLLATSAVEPFTSALADATRGTVRAEPIG